MLVEFTLKKIEEEKLIGVIRKCFAARFNCNYMKFNFQQKKAAAEEVSSSEKEKIRLPSRSRERDKALE